MLLKLLMSHTWRLGRKRLLRRMGDGDYVSLRIIAVDSAVVFTCIRCTLAAPSNDT